MDEKSKSIIVPGWGGGGHGYKLLLIVHKTICGCRSDFMQVVNMGVVNKGTIFKKNLHVSCSTL